MDELERIKKRGKRSSEEELERAQRFETLPRVAAPPPPAQPFANYSPEKRVEKQAKPAPTPEPVPAPTPAKPTKPAKPAPPPVRYRVRYGKQVHFAGIGGCFLGTGAVVSLVTHTQAQLDAMRAQGVELEVVDAPNDK